MARQRRGGFKPPELRGTLGTLLRTTLQQAGVVRDALERGAREGRSRLDDLRTDMRSSRKRQDALAELGEIVLELIRNGEIDLSELPEARDVLDHLEQIDAAGDAGDDQRDRVPTVPPPTRKRFDDRPTPATTDAEDGTVSSGRWSPPPRRPGKPTKVWKPVAATTAAAEPVDVPTAPGHKALPPRDAARKGGIQFEDDLAEYMHPDDVPPKPADD